ncbi:lytic transglycosylase catalytic [Xenorhabdus sp. Flor]|uniref:lytic transglycosylase catalytic n=1 Tax=Xenorhabdus cabanillasii TaxID=351673 RepID=UPI0019976FA9|nr:lytic transglycosylase catalytic [Xenorhabdus sp. Flor]MBD2816349.1 lytic transglycosylase catalytic [Xenorhabdus sp. Flor]
MSNTNADVIKEFLISLGFNIDKPSAKKFSATIAGVTANVLKFGAVVEGAAASVVGFTAVAATQLDKLYWQAQRTGASAEQIKSLGYAVSQVGGTVEGLNSSLENVARFLRNNPGGEGFLRNMGIQTRDTNGQLRDTASLVALVGERLAGMPSYRANMYANMLGIDENTMLAMRRGMGGYAADYHRIIKQLGYDPAVAVKHANDFMTQFTQLKLVTGSAKDKIGGELARTLTPSIEKFTRLILDNWPTIEKVIMSVVKAILTMSEILGQLVFRGAQGIQDLIGWWQQLDKGSQELIKMFGLVAAAWWALNSKFLTSPIGIITTLLAALFLLYDDYKTWQEGGKSLINWSKWEGTLRQLGEGIKQIKDWIIQIKDAVGGWETIFWGFAIFLGTKWLKKVLGVLGVFSAAASKVKLPEMGKFGGPMGGALNLVAQAEQGREQLMQEVQQEAEKTGEDPVKVLDRKLKEKRANEKPFLTWDDITGWFMGSAKASSSNTNTNTNTNARGIRNNNPLNMDYAGQKGAVLENHATPRFAKFATAYEGLAKTAWQLRRYFNGKTTGKLLQTVEDIVSTWAPAGGKDKNNTEAYIQRVSEMMGVGRRDRLDLDNHDIMYALMNAMGIVESKVFPYSKQLVMSAIAGKSDPTKTRAKNSGFNFDPKMFDNATANINNMLSHSSYTPEYLRAADALAQNQTTIAPVYNIHVTGVQSPHEAAALTGETVQRTNAILVRNLQGKVS